MQLSFEAILSQYLSIFNIEKKATILKIWKEAQNQDLQIIPLTHQAFALSLIQKLKEKKIKLEDFFLV